VLAQGAGAGQDARRRVAGDRVPKPGRAVAHLAEGALS
jgi:hypothetical protein